MEARKNILWRIYLTYFVILAFGVSIIARVGFIQFKQGEMWRAKAKSLTTKYMEIQAVRGNIYDCNGNLLATSLPYYETSMDVNTAYLTDEMFYDKVDSLATCLATLFNDKPRKEYYQQLVKARKNHDRYLLLHRQVSFNQLQEMKKFPLLRLGRYKGGFIALQTDKRERPYELLAARTIGYQREDIKPIGLEGAFNQYLKGVSGQRLMQKIAGGVWMPVSNENEIEPQDGSDIVSTIDINLQDVAENALMNQLIKNKAAYGTVVLMEVKTGYIKAIANLSRKDTSWYGEYFNHAIGSATEPGSTFKLASLMAAIEDGYVDLNDVIEVGNGQQKYFDRVMKDSHEPESPKLTVQRIFEVSSNVGVSKIITSHYSKNPQQFIDHLCRWNLNQPLKLSIPGEATPRIKNTSEKDWYGTTLPWISIGYESLITPLQTLTLYNAVANNGVMVRPQFVKSIVNGGRVISSYPPDVMNPAICSKATIEKVRKMMEGVVQNGTGKNLKGAAYQVAGKTGTAQIANNGLYKNGNNVSYQASFVGYFPANDPEYSCIVIVNGPSNGIYYGNVVAGPIFKEIADKVYATSLDIHKEVNDPQAKYATLAPTTKSGSQKALEKVYKELNIVYATDDHRSSWVTFVNTDTTKPTLVNSNLDKVVSEGVVPDVRGMLLRDALFLLENQGLHVVVRGSGMINEQSLKPGEKFLKGTTIVLELI